MPAPHESVGLTRPVSKSDWKSGIVSAICSLKFSFAKRKAIRSATRSGECRALQDRHNHRTSWCGRESARRALPRPVLAAPRVFRCARRARARPRPSGACHARGSGENAPRAAPDDERCRRHRQEERLRPMEARKTQASWLRHDFRRAPPSVGRRIVRTTVHHPKPAIMRARKRAAHSRPSIPACARMMHFQTARQCRTGKCIT